MKPVGEMAVGAGDDDRLFSRIQAGDDRALRELYDRRGAQAHRVALSVCRDREWAEEAVQEAFLSVWRARDTYRSDRGTVGAWVMTIVRYRAIDVMRRNERHSSRRADAESLHGRPADDDVSADVIGAAEADRLRSLLAQLPDAQQEVIGLAYFGQLSHTEIARRLQLPPGTVKGRLRLGMQKLRHELERSA
jgi:RNA polymerase sigma-70 factor, ECF subfamily